MLQIDHVSVERVRKLHPMIRMDVFNILCDLSILEVYIRITDGLRTYKEQKELYAKGRTAKGYRVTDADAGFSWHNYGLAFDFCLLIDENFRNVSWSAEEDANENNISDWSEVVRIAKKYGFEWGGDWTKPDRPHFNKKFDMEIEQARNLFLNNKVYEGGYILIGLTDAR